MLGERTKEHFIAPQCVRSVTFHQVIWGLDVEFGFRHLLHFEPTCVCVVFAQDEFCIGVFRAPLSEGIRVQLISFHKVDVHVQPLGLKLFSTFERDEFLGALNAINEARSSQDHPLIDHLFEGLIEANPTLIEQKFCPEA